MTEKTIRADRLLANLGYGSRKDMAMAIKNGWFEVDGVRMIDPSADVSLEAVRAGRVTFDSEALDPPAPLTILLHKPVGYTCSLKDAGPIIYDLLPPRFRARNPVLSPVGRLDKYSSGMLLLSDDGDFLHRVTHPKTHAEKHYRVVLRDDLRGDEAAVFGAGGMMLKEEEKPLKPARWRAEGTRGGVMVLHEGRYHQIRRMFEALGNEVIALHRYQTGGLMLGDLAEGIWRALEQNEIDKVLNSLS